MAWFALPNADHVFKLTMVYAFFIYLSVYVAAQPWALSIKLPGDFSYGIYLWGWPAQQVVADMVPGAAPEVNAGLSMVLAVGAAVISWYLVERPSLALARTVNGHLKNLRASALARTVNGHLKNLRAWSHLQR